MTDPAEEKAFAALDRLYDENSECLRRLATEEWKNGSHIIIHPEVYKVIENYNKQNRIQRFFQKIKWGLVECRGNFRCWQGHMKGEDWNFWDCLNMMEGYELQ